MATKRSDAAKVRKWEIVRCTHCGHQWDDLDPNAEACACLDKRGSRVVVLVSAGASNV